MDQATSYLQSSDSLQLHVASLGHHDSAFILQVVSVSISGNELKIQY